MKAREYDVMYRVEEEHWWYVGIRRLILSTLARYREQGGPPWRILDAGCGTGAIAGRLEQWGRVTAIDLSALALSFSRRRGLAGRLGQASVTALPLPAITFDLIVSIDVICTVPDDGRALAEFYRVLKPGGLLLLNLPALKWLRGRHDLAVDILRRYTPGGLRDQLQHQGFMVEKLSFANSLLFPAVAPYRLLTNLLPAQEGAARSDVYPLPRLLNTPLAWLMGLEAYLVPWAGLPIGMSLLALARKEP